MLKPVAPTKVIETLEYDHGFSEEEVFTIKLEYEKLQQKVSNGEKLSLSEQEIVFKHFRINRTEVFNLQEQIKASKPKREPKPPKEKPEKKPKKLTKKVIEARLKELTEKQFISGLTEEEEKELEEILK